MKGLTKDSLFGITVTRRLSDGWINASLICHNHKTTFPGWKRSEVGTAFLNYFFTTNDLRTGEVIEYKHQTYFVSPILLIGLGCTLSETFTANYNQWSAQHNSRKEKPVPFTYAIKDAPGGSYRQVMTFKPIKGYHTDADVTHAQSEAEAAAAKVGMKYSSTVTWTPSSC